MKFSVNRESIMKPLQLVSGVVERRQTMPILSNILIEFGPDKLIMTATDLEVELVIQSELDGIQAGKTTLPARKFMDICRALPEGSTIDVTIESEKAILKSGRSRFVLSTLPAEEYPNIDALKSLVEFSVSQGVLRRLIEQSQFAMAQQDVRYYLNGLLFEVSSNELRCVATDGHRLAYCCADVDTGATDLHQVIIPRKGVHELLRLLQENDEGLVHVKLGANHIRVLNDAMGFTSKLIDGRFPDYQRVIPQSSDKIIIGDRNTLRQSLVRASILTNEKYRSVRLSIAPNKLIVLAHNPEQEEAEEEIMIEYEGSEIEIGFNATYLMEAIAAVNTDDVEICLTDPNSCCLIQAKGGGDCKYVVMPMRL